MSINTAESRNERYQGKSEGPKDLREWKLNEETIHYLRMMYQTGEMSITGSLRFTWVPIRQFKKMTKPQYHVKRNVTKTRDKTESNDKTTTL